jgi:uncharacterized protein
MAHRLLVFSKTTGFRHESIEAGVESLREIGASAGFTIEATEDASAFSAGNLASYDTLVFLSPSGNVFDDDQRIALEEYMRAGGGFVGIHAASTAEPSWPFYRRLVGARFTDHPEIQSATMTVEQPGHPATAHLTNTWTCVDEWYNFDEDPRPGVNVLLSVDESTYAGGRMGEGHPIAWYHQIGAARCFYTALGHTVEAYADPTFRQHVLGGIRYALSS